MTRKRDRFFALFGAVLFFATASAFTIAIIANGISNRGNSKDTAATQTTADDCTIGSVGGVAVPVPDVFKPSGDVTKLESTDLEQGGGAVAKSGDCLQVKYYGTLAKDGTVFDENYDKPSALKFKVGVGNVISGWDEGMLGVKEGATRRLVIPSDKAYGASGSGSIPANADLVFVVKVLKIN